MTLRKSGLAALLAITLGACAQAGTLGDVLGGVLNAPTNQNQISATVQGVDTRSQMIFLRQSDGSTISVGYDNRTTVSYQNQTYAVTALENGDQVTARIQNTGNNTYYTDYISVTSSASSNNTSTSSGSLYSLSGSVRQIDRTNGWFTLDTQNSGTVTISMPYNPRSFDLNKFNNLRSGDYVQLQGLYLNQSRFELRQFY